YWGNALIEYGRFSEAIAVLETCIRLGEQVRFLAALVATRANLAWLYADIGALTKGFELTRAATEEGKQFHLFEPMALAATARLHLQQGNLDDAEASVEAARASIARLGFGWDGVFLVELATAELALAQGDSARAIWAMDEALANLNQYEMKMSLPYVLHLKG